jgi:hypothetical protein
MVGGTPLSYSVVQTGRRHSPLYDTLFGSFLFYHRTPQHVVYYFQDFQDFQDFCMDEQRNGA